MCLSVLKTFQCKVGGSPSFSNHDPTFRHTQAALFRCAEESFVLPASPKICSQNPTVRHRGCHGNQHKGYGVLLAHEEVLTASDRTNPLQQKGGQCLGMGCSPVTPLTLISCNPRTLRFEILHVSGNSSPAMGPVMVPSMCLIAARETLCSWQHKAYGTTLHSLILTVFSF